MEQKNIPLTFDYDFTVGVITDNRHFRHRVDLMKRAGVSRVWLDGYFYGKWDTTPEKMANAKRMLEEEGFEVQALNVPLGHGGEALDPSTPFDPSVGEGWHNRINADGLVLPNTTCVDDKVICDQREVALTLKQIGFTEIAYDDDLRMGSWGPNLQGCFCERCLQRFYTRYPRYAGMSRKEIVSGASVDPALYEAWCDVQTDAVPRFLKETTPDGITPCEMVMHNGDERHGLSIRKMKEACPGMRFRVGEAHFDNGSFEHPLAKDAISKSIRRHLKQIGSVDRAFSESTVYPMGALSPQNWIEKMRIEIDCGLRHLFLMSGIVFLTDDYWEALIDAREQLTERAASTPLPDLDALPDEPFVWHL